METHVSSSTPKVPSCATHVPIPVSRPTVVKGRPRPVDVYEVLEVLSKDVQAKREMTKVDVRA